VKREGSSGTNISNSVPGVVATFLLNFQRETTACRYFDKKEEKEKLRRSQRSNKTFRTVMKATNTEGSEKLDSSGLTLIDYYISVISKSGRCLSQ